MPCHGRAYGATGPRRSFPSLCRRPPARASRLGALSAHESVPDDSWFPKVGAAARMEDRAKGEAGVSGNLDELRGRMLARRRRSRLRSTAAGSLVLAAVVSGMGFAAVLLWQQVGSPKPVAGHAASSIQAD